MNIWVDGSTTEICIVMEGYNPIIKPAVIGKKVTSNAGEYWAVIHGLLELIALGLAGEPLCIHSDSQLIVNQLTQDPAGRPKYRTKDKQLKSLREEVLRLLAFFRRVSFIWIPRENNPAGVLLEGRN